MRRFKFNISDFNAINSVLPRELHLGYISDNLVDCYFDEKDIQSLHSSGISLDVICLSKFQQTFESWISQFEIHPYKLYDFVSKKSIIKDTYSAPIDIDFKTQLTITLEKRNFPKVQGKPTKVEYYEKKVLLTDSNGNIIPDALGNPQYQYQNLIAKIDFVLTYDPFGFILQRKEILRWAKTDGSFSTEYKDLGKTFDPVFDHESRIKEGIERRQSIIDNLQLPILAMLKAIYPAKSITEVLLMGRAYLTKMEAEFNNFVKSSATITDINSPDFGRKSAWVAVKNSTEPFLDQVVPSVGVTIKQYIMSELSI